MLLHSYSYWEKHSETSADILLGLETGGGETPLTCLINDGPSLQSIKVEFKADSRTGRTPWDCFGQTRLVLDGKQHLSCGPKKESENNLRSCNQHSSYVGRYVVDAPSKAEFPYQGHVRSHSQSLVIAQKRPANSASPRILGTSLASRQQMGTAQLHPAAGTVESSEVRPSERPMHEKDLNVITSQEGDM